MKKTCNHIPKVLFRLKKNAIMPLTKICPCEENAGYQMPNSRTAVLKL